MNIYTIYKATNLINEKGYVGFTSKSLQRRKSQHLYHDSQCPLFNEALKEFGSENFRWDILYQSKDKIHTLTQMEHFFVMEENTHYIDGWGYNLTHSSKHNPKQKYYLASRFSKLTLTRNQCKFLPFISHDVRYWNCSFGKPSLRLAKKLNKNVFI